uniref:uncharacterized protein LOC127070543 n=1 Tax=Vespula vulgaris TaxID=7454 RepID=UPI00223C07BC|nr:uncharacterized protein LOC127070543 [Vespula vulgaris]
MDSFDHPYYKLNKRLLLLVGQWPYQESSERRFRIFIVSFSLFSFLFTQIFLFFTCNGDIEIIIESMAPVSAVMVGIIKYYTLQFNRDKIKQLLNHLIHNWKLCRTKEELEIMHEFGKETKLFTFWYTIAQLVHLFCMCYPGQRMIDYSTDIHIKAFAELIESFYSVSLLLQAGLSLICMSISLFEMLIVVENRAEAFRYFNFAVAQLLHLFCMCYPGQRMIDYSTDIRIKAYNGLWYEAPLSIHKLLILVIRKSLEPSYLTAGKIFIFCLETFATILQTATSYFMVHTLIKNQYRVGLNNKFYDNYSFLYIGRLTSRKLYTIWSNIGQWPYQDKFDRVFRMCFVISLLISFGVTQISLLYTNGNVDTLIEIIPPITSLITIISKYSMFYISRNNIKNLFERIIKHWKLWESKEEIDIMREYSEEGQLLTFLYTSYIYSCMTLFLLMPFFPCIMDVIVPLNDSRPLRPIFKSEYFIDEDQHFFPIYFHMSIVIVIGITVLISADILLLVFNSHVCGIFTAVGFRLEHLLKSQTDLTTLLDHRSRRICFEHIIRTIEIHKRALEFAELIESSYSFFLLFQVGSSLVCMSLSLYQILIVLKKSSEAFRYIAFAAAQLVHIFCMCYPGQKIIDYSSDICIKAYSGLWYEAPIEIHRLILLVIRRSLQPCYLTAGKAFIFCLESFSTIVQTSTSYFMVISSNTLLTIGKYWKLEKKWISCTNLPAKGNFSRSDTYMKTLLNDIIIDWKIWNTEKEVEIMKMYAKEGRFYILMYTGYVYFTSIVFFSIAFVPRLMDVIQPLNESRPLKLPILCEYFLDQDEHFYLLYFHLLISLLITVTALIAVDTQLMIFTFHVCSVFAVVGYRLENFLKDAYGIENWTNDQCKKYTENLVFSIKGHKRAIEFANCIESTFSYSLLIQCGVNITCMTISLYQITNEWGEELPEVLRYATFIVAQLFHIFYTCYVGQMMIDHSVNISEKAYNSMWYEAPKEINKLLLLIMKKSIEPSNLTAGKIFIFCIESFSSILRTSTSYFMVLSSVH